MNNLIDMKKIITCKMMTHQQNMPTAEDNNELNESHVGVF